MTQQSPWLPVPLGRPGSQRSSIIAPDGTLVASLAYGVAGVVAADIELDRADRSLALRWAPERNDYVRLAPNGPYQGRSLPEAL